jgi:hypothetical protein
MIGEFLIQSDGIYKLKQRSWLWASLKGLTYAALFLACTQSPMALAAIFGFHTVMSRYKLAKYVCYLKNHLAPKSQWHKWADCNLNGHFKDKNQWYSHGKMLIVESMLMIAANYWFIKLL